MPVTVVEHVEHDLHVPSLGQQLRITRTTDFFRRVAVRRFNDRLWELADISDTRLAGGNNEITLHGISAEPFTGYLPPEHPDRKPLKTNVRVSINDRIILDRPLQTLVDDWVSIGRAAQMLGLDRLERELNTLKDRLSEIGGEQMERGLFAIEAAQLAMTEVRQRSKPLALKQPFVAHDDFHVHVDHGGVDKAPFDSFNLILTGLKTIPIGR